MLPWLIGTLVALYAAWKALSKYQALRLNVADAKRTGLPYVIVPVFALQRRWLIVSPIVLPLLRKLPSSWTEPSLTYVSPSPSAKVAQNPDRRHALAAS